MIPIIVFVGQSGAGKTQVVEKVIAELVRRGRRVGAIKHAAHSVELDHPGKDSARFAGAGAVQVAVVGPEQAGFYRQTPEEWTPETLRDLFFEEVEVIVAEGFTAARVPKVLVLAEPARPEQALDLPGLLAVVTRTEPGPALKVPVYSPEDIPGLADLIESQIKAHAPKREVSLYVNGRRIPIKPFIKDFFLNTISAMVDSLKHTENARRIVLTLDRGREKSDD